MGVPTMSSIKDVPTEIHAWVPMPCAVLKTYIREQRDVPLLFAIGFYALNIIEANVDAHLKQFNVDERLTLEPFIHNDLLTQPQFGLTLTYKSKK